VSAKVMDLVQESGSRHKYFRYDDEELGLQQKGQGHSCLSIDVFFVHNFIIHRWS
jgi:hypothetical protein